MSTPPPQPSRRSAEGKKITPPPASIVTRNGARKCRIQTRSMAAGVKPSAAIVAAKKKALQKKKTIPNTELKDPYQIAMDSKTKVKGPVGFVTEPRMAEHRCLWDDSYPECPERLTSVLERCKELNLIDQCQAIEPRSATEEELSMLHSPSVYAMLETTHNNQDLPYLEELSSKYDAIYIHPSTHFLALLAAGSTISLIDNITSGSIESGAAFIRPPGHHAMRSEPCGYCFYNNVALAARHAIDNRGVNRVLIVDWDVHHGQATQQMFYDDPRVLYFSVHRYEHGSFWPYLRQSDFPYIGAGKGRGFTCNVPLNKTGMTDADYMAIWHQLLLPMALEFSPQLVVVSAGFDSAMGDEKGEMLVTPACYASLLHMLLCVCPRVGVVLEGGYCLASLAEGAALTLRTLLGHMPPRLELDEPCESIRDTILNCIYVQKRYWNCFSGQSTYVTSGAPNVDDASKEKHVVTVRWTGDETRPDKFATRDCYPVQDDQFKRRVKEQLDHLRIVTDLSIPEHAVSYAYDQAMLKHKNICEPGHPECPERILRIHERLRDYQLLERMLHLPHRTADDLEILAVHTDKHLERLKDLASTKLRDLNSQKEKFDSVYFHPDSLESASVAAGSVLQAVDSVLNQQSNASVCVIRPPGHHADDETPSGFCLLNNAAMAAKYAIDRHGVKKVMILDWDVHHGNGTQRITYEDDRILYVSIHRYDHGSFFPHSPDADHKAVGAGKGEGYNVNVPWNKRGMGDAEYLTAFTHIVLPIAYEYNPDLVIVSAGFDACVGDPLGGCKVTPECYGRMTQFLRGLAAGRVILCLEGGYNVTSISYAMTMCTKALLGDPIPPAELKHPIHWSAVESINDVIRTHKKYWKCLKFQVALPSEDVLEPLHPSRGLQEDFNVSSSTLDVSSKSQFESSIETNVGNFETSLESDLKNLSLDKCADGVHCGTDDEDESPDKSDNNKQKSPSNNEGSSQKERTKKRNSPHSENKEPNEWTNKSETLNPPTSEGISTNESTNKKNQEGSSKTEKPTLVDYLSQNMQALVEGSMFAVIPLPWCPHLESLYAIPSDVRFEQRVKCVDCDHTDENWVCLHCYITACARSINGHMQAHYASTGHTLALSLTDLSVWCSECDAYVDNSLLYDAKNNAHRHKFGEDMPWCYADTVHMD